MNFAVATFLPLVSTIFIALSAIFVAIGWYFIARRKVEAHKKVMFWAAMLATIFFILYLSKTIFIGSTSFGGPDSALLFYRVFLIIHITLATVAAVLGIIALVTGYKNKFAQHRKIGPLTSVIWFFSAGTGIVVYFMLYIIYPAGETTNLFRAIIGG
ncbi:putative membrane protein [Evansella caseinilytica]|uniref:Putative membrane protein n=1 Tax=Evansella caseinilytica TaxID=1503961 RepID=A0A1H3MKW3_9BACI|nr:DUF420 domain-containing protein [Evansella caseinilytica]SDY77233.1 putative membrane protein [Evansella caseinilytica]